jgi:hypothetical protein
MRKDMPPINHISDYDLERYHLGMVNGEAEVALLEEHLLMCGDCVNRAEQNDAYVDAIRRVLILGDYDNL